MRILSLDAAGLTCSVALLDGADCLAERTGGDSRAGTASMPVLIHDLLHEFGRDLDAVAVTVGPGSFTGLRGALALAHGVALASGIPVIGVTVAEALLLGVAHTGPVWVALDARRAGRVFLDSGDGMAVHALDALPPSAAGVLVLGDAGEAVCALVPGTTAGTRRSVSACDVGRVARRRSLGEVGPCEPQPLYVEAPAFR